MSSYEKNNSLVKINGFSLVQILIFTAVSAIVMTAFTSMVTSSARQVYYLESRMELMNFKQELNLLLMGNNPANCNDSFKGLTDISLAGSTTGDFTDITSQLSGTNPLFALKKNYTDNNRYVSINKIYLFKPYKKVDNTLNNSPPIYEFKVKIEAQEKTGSGMILNLDGPTVNLNITSGTTIDSPAACAISTSGSVTVRTNTGYSGGRWVTVTANCLPGETALGGGGLCIGSVGEGVVHGTYGTSTSFTISSCGDPATYDWSGWTGTAYVYCRAP